MRQLMMFIGVLFACGFVLIGCSSDNENANNNQNNGENTEANNEQNNDNTVENNNNSQNENDSSEDNNLGNDNEDNDDNNDTDSSFEPEEEDQEGLGIGDTGTFDTTLGSYEMTLDSAKLIGAELDDVESMQDELILMDITIKNTSDQEQNAEDLLESMNITDDLKGGGFYDGAEDFESIDKFSEAIEPGETRSGQFITDVDTVDKYYFRKDEGNIAGGSSNQVIWEFEPEEE